MMHDAALEVRRGTLLLTTDRARLDRTAVLALLRTTPWARTMQADVLDRAIENSVCAAVFDGATLVAFARAVTDLATFAYWSDVVVAESHRGRGIARWMGETMLSHPQMQQLRRVSLLTLDAGPLYEKLGFTRGAGDLTYMERR